MQDSLGLDVVKERIQKLVDALGIDQVTLANTGEVRKQTVTDYLKGKSLPSAKVLALWSQKFRVNVNWLLTGQGEIFIGAAAKAAPEDQPMDTPVADAIRKAEVALRRAGASEQSVWGAVQSLAKDRLR